MFETTVVESKKSKTGLQKYMTLPVSLALHAIVIGGALFGAVWNVDFPDNSPAQVAQYSVAAAPPPPPPPPPPPKAAPKVTPVKPVEVPKDIQNLAPTVVPDQVKQVETPATVQGADAGVEGGVEGGVAGGVVGGVVGGVITEAKPDVPLRVGGDVKAPVVITRVEPTYPEVARKARIAGIVIVECIIDKNGNVTNVQVLKPLPFGLDQAAADAVRRWKFKPGTLNGQPVDVIFNLTVNFKLN